ncbi:WhiB family transcriptional regulator [Rhodococcus sp. ACS1]|uniref:WhiB family transcriptional regulator n=1 Tax=Rhodococcus TaxID=1827 RepID=UPI000BB142E2|nr:MULTISPECIES: WhiB family transcriptional regulator [Rhodococcus]PBC36898.1 WhiB family transcriptional regulator [Rhodococcus sp. ACS1]QSE81437.1 WhiB family transcriptional regulator [Rhodococcus koreensis]
MSEQTLDDRFSSRETGTRDSGEWRARAACHGAELTVFFSPDAERGRARDRREARARQICQRCPVLAPCRDHALAVGEPYGVWGGMTEGDRRKYIHQLRRNRRRPLESRHTRPVADVPQTRSSTQALPQPPIVASPGGAARGRPSR